MIIRSRSVGRVGKALAHNEIRCVARADNPSAVATVRRGQVSGISRSQGRWAMGRMRSKAIGLLGFPFIYQAARVPQTRDNAGIAPTHHLKAVTRACQAWTGFGKLAGTSSFGRRLAWVASDDSFSGAIQLSSPSQASLYSVVREHITTCVKLDMFAGQTGNLTRQLRNTLQERNIHE